MKNQLPFAVLALAALCGCESAPSTADLRTVENFDPRAYCGTWYEIARLPHSFERGMRDVAATYTMQSDGSISVENRGVKDGREKSVRGYARLKKGHGGRGELEVSFFRPFYGAYRVLYLEPDGSAALVTGGTRNYFWILARTREIPADKLERYRELAKRWDFAVGKLEYPNSPEPAR